MEKKKNTKRKLILGVIALIAAVVVLAVIYVGFRPQGGQGSKNITVSVVYGDQTTDTFQIQTDEEFLRGAMEQEKLIQGEEGEFGLYITAINGVVADYNADQSWWCITQNGEMVSTGVDATPIADGEQYEFTYTIG